MERNNQIDAQLEVRSLEAGYGKEPVISIDSLSVARGEFIGLAGPNGAGKTTLLRALTGIIPVRTGSVSWGGKQIGHYRVAELARLIAVVAQNREGIREIRVKDMVALGRIPYFRRFQWNPSSRDRQEVDKALELTETGELKNRIFEHLSGGEQQRVLLASALAQNPDILFLDEPTQHLDIKYQIEIFDLLRDLNQQQKLTVIAVLHDLNLVGSYCPRLIFLKEGRIFKDGPTFELLTEDNLKKLFRIDVEVWRHPRTSHPVILPAGPADHSI